MFYDGAPFFTAVVMAVKRVFQGSFCPLFTLLKIC